MMNNIYDKVFTQGWTMSLDDIYSDYETFINDFNTFKDLQQISFKNAEFLKHIYLILLGEYASSSISNMSVDQFKIRFWTRVNQYGPQYERELEIQKDLIGLTEKDLEESSSVIYNSAINPASTVEDPSSTLIKELNTQNTTFHKRSKLDAYAYLKSLLDKNLSSEFVSKFKGLFTYIYAGPQLYYKTYISEEDDGNSN